MKKKKIWVSSEEQSRRIIAAAENIVDAAEKSFPNNMELQMHSMILAIGGYIHAVAVQTGKSERQVFEQVGEEISFQLAIRGGNGM